MESLGLLILALPIRVSIAFFAETNYIHLAYLLEVEKSQGIKYQSYFKVPLSMERFSHFQSSTKVLFTLCELFLYGKREFIW